MDDTMKERLPS